MDEIEWIKNIKKALKIFAILFASVGMTMAFLAFIFAYNEPKFVKIMAGIGLEITVGFTLFLAMAYFILYIIYRIKYMGRKEIILEKEYLREMPKKYSPALSSLVYDLKIDIYKDYTATILYLCTKKYINIKQEKMKYQFEILNKDSSDLSKIENYVFDKIINKTKFEEEEFKKIIIEEAIEDSLIVNNTKNEKVPNELIIFLILILMVCMYNINKYLFLVLVGVIPYLFFIIPILRKCNDLKSIKEKYKRSHKGKMLAKELQALKNYIKEYTLIKEKNIEHIQILEEYIPYAISLGEAKAIEEFIKYNEEYRSLIYNKNRRII